MRDILNLGVRLLIITVVAAFCLAVTNAYTEGPIKITTENANNEARRAVMSEAQDFEIVNIEGKNTGEFDGVLEVYSGLDAQGQRIGYTIKTLSKGYGGNIEIIVGIKEDGKISGIQIGNHSETPGLGAKAAEPGFATQFAGKAATEPLGVSKSSTTADNEIQAITGATITSKAVTDGVNLAIRFLNEKLR